MHDDATPVAARRETAQLETAQLDGATLQTDANLHVVVTGATRKFHLWQQGPAWLLGFAAVGLGFLMVIRDYDSPAGWFAVSTAIVLSVIASFRSPFSLGETAVSTAPSRRGRKPPTETPPTNALPG